MLRNLSLDWTGTKTYPLDQSSTLQYRFPLSFLLLLLLSRFSRVQLCATPQMAAHQALPSLGFSRQEHWSGLPFPSPMHESEKWKWSCSVVSDSSRPMDCSLPGSSVHGIFQARTGVGCHYPSYNPQKKMHRYCIFKNFTDNLYMDIDKV